MIKCTHFIIIMLSLLLFSCSKDEKTTVEEQEKGGVLNFNSGPDFGNKTIPVHYFIPKGQKSQMQFQIVLHGDDRNAREYIAAWAQKGREYGIIVIAPEFSEAQFNTALYHQGNAVINNQLNAPEKTTFSLIDRIFEFVKVELKISNTQYNIYGHSAGAQFVHRFVGFYNSPYLKSAVSANSGWYTFPDETINYPYGIRNLISDNSGFRGAYYQKELIILLGTADTLRSGGLRTTAQADSQGKNRLERGIRFFNVNSEKAILESHTFNWRISYGDNIGHDHTLMSQAAADFLYK